MDKAIITYDEVLENIEGKENHLLIGNGFNYGLGVNTGYSAIFQKMIDNSKSLYKDALPMVEDSNFDLETFIGKLEQDISADNLFLRKYVKNKVKLDFMQATHEIVKSNIKNVYAEKNEGIYMLLKNFTNYFTLNYDSFIYLLLLKYKKIDNEEKNTIVFQPTIKFIENDLNTKQNNIYKEIKSARENGTIEINVSENDVKLEKDLRIITKSYFTNVVKDYSKTNKKGWKSKDIDKVVSLIIKEEQTNKVLNKVDDGSRQLNLFGNSEFVFEDRETQNLFFLHGAFHIYKDGTKYKKITQQSDKALYEKLEEILNNEEQDIVCIFQKDNKIEEINKNKYLKNCLKKLERISGNLVIIGSSLADNDNHIFDKINNSKIDTIYISVLRKECEKIFDIVTSLFPEKKVCLFDAETISYEIANQITETTENN